MAYEFSDNIVCISCGSMVPVEELGKLRRRIDALAREVSAASEENDRLRAAAGRCLTWLGSEGHDPTEVLPGCEPCSIALAIRAALKGGM